MQHPEVHWHEGMFLRPQHLQAATRHAVDRHAAALAPYPWGCRTLSIDADALGNGRFVVRELFARLPDGTLARTPEDAAPAPLDLQGPLDRARAATIYLAVPLARPGRPVVSEENADALVRHSLHELDLDDENSGADPEPVVVRRPNLQLIAGDRPPAGYSALPLARVERSDRSDGRPRLVPGDIPPLLASDAWPPLYEGIGQALFDRVGKKVDVLASQVRGRGVADAGSLGDALTVMQLRALNEISATLEAVAFTPGLPPLTLYVELCRAVGALSLFGATARPPALPRYDHDRLGETFYPLKRILDDLLDRVVEPEFKDRPLVGAGLRMQVELEPAWVEANWQLYIGAQSRLPADELTRLLTQPGALDMKVGSSERVDAIFRAGRAGLRFQPVAAAPRVLPSPAGLVYFQIAADPAGGEWPEVQRSLSLAVRINENRVAGSIQGLRDITVQTNTEPTTLRFTLFAVPLKSLRPGERLGGEARP